MQVIIPTALTPEQYAEQDFHKQVKPPRQCPNCKQAAALEALGYYSRFITDTRAATILSIWIRRFLCLHCRISLSCLPGFAQPYRLINTQSVQAGFNGQNKPPQMQRWLHLIRAYWRRFEEHLPELLRQVGNAFGPLAVAAGPKDFWAQLLSRCGGLAAATRELVQRFATCLFGTYRCHQRKFSQPG